MGKIIAVVSGKGGTGKTTFTANTWTWHWVSATGR